MWLYSASAAKVAYCHDVLNVVEGIAGEASLLLRLHTTLEQVAKVR